MTTTIDPLQIGDVQVFRDGPAYCAETRLENGESKSGYGPTPEEAVKHLRQRLQAAKPVKN